MKITKTHVYFWGGYLSNFAYCDIHYFGHKFYTSEQLFMWLKAKKFNDDEALAKLEAGPMSPKDAKAIGRSVKNFNNEVWDACKEEVMFTTITVKFNQNLDFKKELLKLKGKIMVEASPFDKIWGVGLKEDDPLILDEKNWKGENLLGKCLTQYLNEN